MSKFLKVLRWLTAIGTVLILLLLAWQCVDIYVTGSRSSTDAVSERADFNIFRMDDVAARLSRLALPMVAYGVLLVLSGSLHMFCGQGGHKNQGIPLKRLPYLKKVQEKKCSRKRIPLSMIRLALFGGAVMFIVLGVMNDGWYDVLVKAISICTECIGLG